MAVVKTIIIKADVKQAEKSFDELGAIIQEQKDITIEFEKELIRLENELASTSKRNIGRQKALRKEIIKIRTAVKGQRVAVRDLTNQQKKTAKSTDGLTKSVAKNFGAIQLLDKVTGGAATQFRSVVDASRLFNKSLLNMRAALIGTGIGALVIALGLIVVFWEDIVDFITGASKKLEEQHALLSANLGLINSEIKLNEKRTKFNEDNNTSTVELLRLNKELLLEKQKLIAEDIKILEAQLLTEESAARELNFLEKLGLNTIAFARLTKSGRIITSEEQKRINEIRDQINTLKGDALEIAGTLLGTSEDPETEKRAKEQKVDTTTAEEIELETAKEQKIFEAIFDLKEINNQLLLDQQGNFLSKEKQAGIASEVERNDRERAEGIAREEFARLEAEAKIELLFLVSDAFAAAGDLIGRETAAGKALSVSSALISTYLAATQAFQSQFLPIPTVDSPIRAALAAGVAVAAGLANVKQILAVKIPGGGGGSSIGTAPSTPPSFNVVQNSPQNQLNQALLQQNDMPTQAFVVDKEITTAQELSRNKVAASSLG